MELTGSLHSAATTQLLETYTFVFYYIKIKPHYVPLYVCILCSYVSWSNLHFWMHWSSFNWFNQGILVSESFWHVKRQKPFEHGNLMSYNALLKPDTNMTEEKCVYRLQF